MMKLLRNLLDEQDGLKDFSESLNSFYFINIRAGQAARVGPPARDELRDGIAKQFGRVVI